MEGRNEWFGHVHPATVRPIPMSAILFKSREPLHGYLHVICPLGIAIVKMWRLQRADVMRLAVVVPGDDLQEPRFEAEDLIPAIIPQKIRWKHPILAVRNLLEIG